MSNSNVTTELLPKQGGATRQPRSRDTVRLAVLRYLLNSSQEFRDQSRGQQITRIREDYGWCESSILTVAWALSYWQSHVHVAPASPSVEAKRFRKKRTKRMKAIDRSRRKRESLRAFQQRVLEKLPADLKELARTQLGVR